MANLTQDEMQARVLVLEDSLRQCRRVARVYGSKAVIKGISAIVDGVLDSGDARISDSQ